MVCVPSDAHYNYPFVCCQSHDCGQIKEIKYISNGDRIVTIVIEGTKEERTAIFTHDFKDYWPPVDDKSHACINNSGKPICLLMNGGV